MTREQKTLSIAGQQLVLKDLSPDDRQGLLRLHQQIFSSCADAHWFDWKYVAGRGDGVGLWNEDQEMVAYCGGLPRSMYVHGQQRNGLQIGDLMVSPQWRGVMARKSPFWHACEHFYTTRLGRERPFQLGFGFTHARALRLHVKLGLSWDVGTVQLLQWPTRLSRPRLQGLWPCRTAPLSAEAPHFRAVADAAWQEMQRSARQHTVGARDADYLLWRFARRPDKQYRFFTLHRRWHWQTRPLGILVLSMPSHPGEAVQWLDWVGPLAYAPHACQAALHIARQDGAPHMTAWASASVAQALAPTDPASMGSAAEFGILTASDLPADQVPQMNLWMMSGDTDFV